MQGVKGSFSLFRPDLITVFMVEMWERFAFYGGRAVLVLFLISPAAQSGLGLPDASATSIYGLYTAMALLLGLLAGWVSDAYIGARSSVALGGILILTGNTMLSAGAYFSNAPLVYSGLACDALGIAFLKPNASSLVAQLYPDGGAERDAGFLVFYTGISIGALVGSLAIPLLAARFGWWAGFASTSVGMLIGLVQFYLRSHHLRNVGLPVEGNEAMKASRKSIVYSILLSGFAILVVLQIDISLPALVEIISWLMVAVAFIYFTYLVTRPDVDTQARKRMFALILLCIGLSLYLVGYHQGGSSLNIFTERFTDREIRGWEIPAGAFQSIIPFASIIFAPVFAIMWVQLGARGIAPSSIIKFGVALLLMGLGFLIMTRASANAAEMGKVLPVWLVCTFVVHTFADLFIAPIGLSAASKLAPPNRLAQTIGLWFVFGAIGNALSGVLAGKMDLTDAARLSEGFYDVFLMGLFSALAMFALAPFYRRLCGGRSQVV